MNQLSDVMDMDLDVFSSLLLHWISTNFDHSLVVTPDDNHTMELNTELSEEFMNPKCLNSDGDRSYVLILC